MKRLNILFLENETYFSSLGIFESEQFNVTCDGIPLLKKSINKIEEYDLVVSLLYNNPLSNFYIYKAVERSIPTLLVSDGIIEWENMFSNPFLKNHNLNLFHPILHDFFFCVGLKECFYFNHLGVDTIQFLPKRILNMKQSVKKASNSRFLITTANTAYYNEGEMNRLIDLISELLKQLKLEQIDYIFRIFDEKLIDRLSIPEELNFTEGAFTDILNQVDCVITTPSSISIEAMRNGRPVGHLLYRDSPVFLQSGWNISSSVDLAECLRSMLRNDEERMNFQYAEIERYISTDSAEAQIVSKVNKFAPRDICHFIDQNNLNMLNSKFNFNIEFFLRKLYLKFKRNSFLRYIRKNIR